MEIKLNSSSNPSVDLIEREFTLPQIGITPGVISQIQRIVHNSEQEVSWLCHVARKENIFLLDDIFIIEQEVTPTEAEMSPEGLSKFAETIIRERGIEYYNDILFWGHSHVNMSVSPSAQDIKQIKEFSDSPYYLMMIINKQGDIYSALYDFQSNIKYTNIPVSIFVDVENEQDISKKIDAELKEKVKKRTFSNVNIDSKYKSMQTSLLDDIPSLNRKSNKVLCPESMFTNEKIHENILAGIFAKAVYPQDLEMSNLFKDAFPISEFVEEFETWVQDPDCGAENIQLMLCETCEQLEDDRFDEESNKGSDEEYSFLVLNVSEINQIIAEYSAIIQQVSVFHNTFGTLAWLYDDYQEYLLDMKERN